MSRLLRLTAELLLQIARDGDEEVEKLEHLALEVDVVADRLKRMVEATARGMTARTVA